MSAGEVGLRWLVVAVAGGSTLIIGWLCLQSWWTNPRVVRELREAE